MKPYPQALKALTSAITATISILFLISLSACGLLNKNEQASNSQQSNSQKPNSLTSNIVLILIDDLSHYGINAYGAKKVISLSNDFVGELTYRTPNIDQLAENGLRFDHAYASPLCENTRVALMTGKVNDRNFIQPKALHESEITFGDIFQQAGYKTGLFGKWKQSRGTGTTPATHYLNKFGWQEWAAFDVTEEGQRFINPNLVINGVVHNYQGRKDVDPQTGRRWYGPDIINRHALSFIDKHKDEPFFLYYPMLLVHDDHKPTPDTKPEYLFDQFDEANHNHNGHTGDQRQYFVDMIEYTDTLIGRVVNKLKQHNLEEDTLIVIVGDNGTKQTFAHVLDNGEIYIGQKGVNTDNGTHVPLILSQPGTIPHSKQYINRNKNNNYRVYDGLTSIIDILPTIVEAAAIQLPNKADIDGISFWQQATGANFEEHRDHIYQWFVGNNHYTKTDKVVTYTFNKKAKYYAPSPGFPDGRFFDLTEDLFEQSGDKTVNLKWGLKLHSGYEFEHLNTEQISQFKELKQKLEYFDSKDVKELNISAPSKTLVVGQSLQIQKHLKPLNARRSSLIWFSSNPDVISINKFGIAKAIKSGEATITAYSWSDANPIANASDKDYDKNALHADLNFIVTE